MKSTRNSSGPQQQVGGLHLVSPTDGAKIDCGAIDNASRIIRVAEVLAFQKISAHTAAILEYLSDVAVSHFLGVDGSKSTRAITHGAGHVEPARAEAVEAVRLMLLERSRLAREQAASALELQVPGVPPGQADSILSCEDDEAASVYDQGPAVPATAATVRMNPKSRG